MGPGSLPAGAARLAGGAGKEAAKPDSQLHAQPHELVGPHGALAIEDAPEPFAVNADAAGELRHADAALPARLFHPGSYEVDVLHDSFA